MKCNRTCSCSLQWTSVFLHFQIFIFNKIENEVTHNDAASSPPLLKSEEYKLTHGTTKYCLLLYLVVECKVPGWQKLQENTKGLRQKVWTRTKSPNKLFCRDIKICCDLCTFWKSSGKKCLFGSKTVFLGQEVHYNMVFIANCAELNVKICNYAQNRRICCENSKYASGGTRALASARDYL